MAGGTTLVAGIAGRYATALFDLARESDALDTTAEELRGLEALLRESEDLARLVLSPVFSTSDQSAAVDEIVKQAEISVLTGNFLKLLARNRRLFVLSDIAKAFRKLLADHRNEITAEVTSAVPLSDDQADELRATLKAKTGRNIDLDAHVDPSLIGGLVVKIGSRMVDSSIRTKLNNLKFAMKEAG
ncbi:MAG: F0F1 ATP synthase subunit delta [Hyphomicrobiales bacterium]|nr:F0F1 ATP synthase subunit delta [Hyphomicrobiales bacterium]